jgi:hypothetical protein
MSIKGIFGKIAGDFFLYCKKVYAAYYRMTGSIRKKITCLYDDHFIKSQYKKLSDKKKLTKEQKKEIQSFYKSIIGKKVNLASHEYFYSRNSFYSKEYVPKSLHEVELIPKANMMPYRNAYADKNMVDVLLPDVKHPHTILKRINGYFYFENKPVSKQEAVSLCQNMHNAIIKPVLSHSGEGIKSLEVENGMTNINGWTIEQLFDKYGDNFQIQERLKQHEKMSQLNETSVNTLRILTYRSDMEILVIYSVVRIGRKGQVIDNQTAGGISTIIGEDGKLGNTAFGGFCENGIGKTDSGVVLDGFEIPSYQKALDTVKRLHYQLPYFNFVGWDVAIDELGDPVIIEWNACPGLSQSAFGPGYGKYTERILRELWPRKNTKYSM